MAELPKPSDIVSLVSLLAPGLLVLGVRNRFREGTPPELKLQLIHYAVASVAYITVVSPFFHINNGFVLPRWLWSLLQFGLVPIAIGIAIVWIDQSERFYQLCRWAGLRVSHHAPTAWDFAFSRVRRAAYVLVKLNDGTQYAGLMGSNSFASSNASERDLLLEEVWSVKGDDDWTKMSPGRAVLLCGKNIRYIEIFHRS